MELGSFVMPMSRSRRRGGCLSEKKYNKALPNSSSSASAVVQQEDNDKVRNKNTRFEKTGESGDIRKKRKRSSGGVLSTSWATKRHRVAAKLNSSTQKGGNEQTLGHENRSHFPPENNGSGKVHGSGRQEGNGKGQLPSDDKVHEYSRKRRRHELKATFINSTLHCQNNENALPNGQEQDGPRVLRPRLTTTPTKWQRTKQKLYKEVDLCEADGPRILAHRIKVWWPLDAAWYYGEVKEYDRKKRLHRVVYDDQEEEWLYLENERFMLQVDEGEVFGRLGEIVSEFVGKRKHHRRRLKKKQHRSKYRGPQATVIDAVGHVSEENVIRPVEHCTLSTKQIGNASSPPTLDALLENTRKEETKDDCRNLKAIIPIRNPRVWPSRRAGYIECLPLYRPFANMILTMGYHLLKWSIGSRLPLSMRSIRSVMSRDFLNHIFSRLSLVKNWPGSGSRNSITVSIPNMLCADLFSEVFGFRQVPSKRPVRDKSVLIDNGSQLIPSRRKRDSHTVKIALIEDCCFLDFPLQPANNSSQLSRSYDPENKVLADPLVNAEAPDSKHTWERRICLVSNSRRLTSGPILNVFDKLKSENSISSKRGQPSMALVDLGTNRKLQISEDPDKEKLQKMDLSNIYKRSKFTAEHLTIDCNPQEPSTVTPQIGLRRCTAYKGDVSDDDSMGAETPVRSKKAVLDVESEHDASVRNWRSVGFAAESIEGEMADQCWWDSSSYMLHDVDLEIRKCRRVENVGIPEDLEVSPSDNRASPSANHPSQAKSQFKVNRLSGSGQQKLIDVDSASCTANVLVMKDDRGWRETGATVHLKSVDGGWMLLIDIHGETAYGHKAEQFAAVGAANRYTHAMMWKGGKGWILEFEDRKHWSVFKMMHEECFQRNARAACIRHIPVPCFQPVEDYFTRMPPSTFARPAYRYIRYSEADSDMGSSSRILYDMDSEDEEWLTQSCRGDEDMLLRPNVLELTFEQIVDRLEKTAHVQQNDVLSADAAIELCEGLASLEVVGRVYAHWSKKRRIKGMSLIRYFQAAPWERYQEQLERWNEELQQKSPSEIKQQPISQSKKPPPYAFCLRPRGLEMPNKLQKQRSQRKQLYSRQYGELFSESPRQQLATDSKTEWPTGLTSGIQQINEDEPAKGPQDSLLEGSTIKDMANDRWIFQHRSTASIDHILKARKGRKMRRRTVYAEDSERRRIRSNVCFRLQQQQRQSHVYRGHRPWHAGYSKLVSPSAVSNDGMSNQPRNLSEIAAAAVKNAVMARARAETAYALADVAMHRAMSAVIAAEAIQAAEAAALSAYNARERQRGETCSADEMDAGVCLIDENDAGPIQIDAKRLSEGDACVQPAQTSSQTGNKGLTAVGLDSGVLDTAVEVQSGALDIDEGELLGKQDKLQRIASLLRNPLSPSQRLEQLHQGSMVEAMPT